LDEPEQLHLQPYHEIAVVVQYWCRTCHALGRRYDYALVNVDSHLTSMDKLADQVPPHVTTSHPQASKIPFHWGSHTNMIDVNHNTLSDTPSNPFPARLPSWASTRRTSVCSTSSTAPSSSCAT
jgi:hypothetical protein